MLLGELRMLACELGGALGERLHFLEQALAFGEQLLHFLVRPLLGIRCRECLSSFRAHDSSYSARADLELAAKKSGRRQARPPDERGGRLAAVEAARDPAEDRRQAAAVELGRAVRGQGEAQRYAVALDEVAVGNSVDAALLGEVEDQLDLVRLGHVERVFDREAPLALVE